MRKEMQRESACRNIFEDGREVPSGRRFTQLWIELINRIEKNKQTATGKQ